MKQRNLILPALLAASIASPAMANINSRQSIRTVRAQEHARLEEVKSLLERLSELGALETDENEDLKIEKSIMDTLKEQGRGKVQFAGSGSICT